MGSGCIRDHATPWGPDQQTLLQQKGFDDGFQGDGILAKSRGQGVQAHRSTSVLLEQQGEKTPVAGIEAAVVDPMQAQGIRHHSRVDHLGRPPNGGDVADASKQPIGDPWCSTAGRGDG